MASGQSRLPEKYVSTPKLELPAVACRISMQATSYGEARRSARRVFPARRRRGWKLSIIPYHEQSFEPPRVSRNLRGCLRYDERVHDGHDRTDFGSAGSVGAAECRPVVFRCSCRPIGCAIESGHGRHESAAGLSDWHRSPEARRQRGRRRHRHGRDAQRHRTEHDRDRRRRVHAVLFSEDEKAGRAQCQRTRTAGAEPRLLHLAEDRPDADDRAWRRSPYRALSTAG